jgi:hypothetical protein
MMPLLEKDSLSMVSPSCTSIKRLN